MTQEPRSTPLPHCVWILGLLFFQVHLKILKTESSLASGFFGFVVHPRPCHSEAPKQRKSFQSQSRFEQFNKAGREKFNFGLPRMRQSNTITTDLGGWDPATLD